MHLGTSSTLSSPPPVPLFLQHLSHQTSSHHIADEGDDEAKDRAGGLVPGTKGHVLFVSRQRIVGRTNGSSVYLLDLAAAVRNAGFTPHLIQPSPDLMGRWPIMRLGPELKVFQTHRIRGVLRSGRWVMTLNPKVGFDAVRGVVSRFARRFGVTAAWSADRPRPYAIAAKWTAADRAYLKHHAPEQVDIVIADYAFQAEAIDLFLGRPSAIVMHDLFHSREARDGTDSVSSLDRDTEIALLSRADAVVAIQSTEARFIAENVASARPIVAGMAVHPVKQPQVGDGEQLLFVGSNTAPNVVGLRWMFDNVWPLVRARSPGVTLNVAGSVAGAFPNGGPRGVTFHGIVADLAPYYASAGIIISPLTFGSGLKIKLVEAMAQGKAIVATGVTLQGVEDECRGAVAHADTPEAFTAAILELADENRRLSLGQAALTAARRYFSPAACHGEFAAWLEENRPRACSACGSGASG
jgi:glycosyltransferase involved in cell wall biosynthesis